MTGLLGTVVDAAIGWLVQSILGSFFTGQMEAWTREIGLAEDVENLKFEMRNVEMVLAAAEGRMIDNKPLAGSLDDLKELLYDSEDVMDELDYYRLQQQIEGEACSAPIGTNPEGIYVSSSTPSSAFELVRTATSQITSWASSGRKRKREEEGPAHSTMLTFEIKDDISKRIKRIVNRLRNIGNSVKGVLKLEISRPIATSGESQNVARNARLTTSVPIEHKVYGRDAERDKIIELLIKGESSDLNVLPVVGIGGVGKTTLARFVYRDERIKDHFDLQMWVCVSTNFDEMRLTLEILDHVCKDRQEYEKVSNFNVLQEILLKYIRNKRFLLVLDDVWEDRDRSGWVKLLAPLKRNQVTGCMILATTRRKSVAKMIGTMVEVEVNGLDEKEFWLFFRACAFGNENYEGLPILQSIGQQIAKALKGCPLAARSVGALLYTSVSVEHWRTVQDKWKSLQEEKDDILPILKLSYDYLPVHLQKCFSYCSLFPEDHPFNGEILVRAWISQNFVQCKDPTMRLEETGQQYLDRLVDLGFFQIVGSHYVMHDLMHELAEKVSSNECATIHGLKTEAIQPSVRHLSIITTAFDKDKPGCFPTEKFDKILQMVRSWQKLRTLMLFGSSSINLLRSLHTLFKEAKYLRFLRIYVTGADISSIYSLNPCHLRYLKCVFVPTTNTSVYGVYINPEFPQALTRFSHLQVLDVGISRNFAVPASMNNLVNLRHLIAHEEVPEHTREDMPAANCKAFPSLESLTIKYCGIAGKWLPLMLRHAPVLEELILENCPHITTLLSMEEEENTAREDSSSGNRDGALTGLAPEGFLHIPLNPISSLKKITVKHCPRLTFDGSKEGLSVFTALEKLVIWECPQMLSSLVHRDGNDDLANGRWLLPQSLGELEIRGDSPETLQPCFPRNLTCLKKLEVLVCHSLKSLQLHSCTALEELKITICESLAALEGLQSLGSLTYLEVTECDDLPPLSESFSRAGYALCPRLETLVIYDPSVLTTSLCKHLTSLRRLELYGMEITDEQERALVLLKSLQQLKFISCGLVYLPAGLHTLPFLKRLKIDYCKEISRLSETCLPPSLEELEIEGCSKELADQCRLLATSKLNVKIV